MTLFRKKKPNLREECRKRYGDAFVEKYDKLNNGEAIGNLSDTLYFLSKVKAVKKELGL